MDRAALPLHRAGNARGASALSLQARVYDPVIGRFLQTDPVGYQVDTNLYAYVGGDPINLGDPTGLAPNCETQGASSCRVAVGRLRNPRDDSPSALIAPIAPTPAEVPGDSDAQLQPISDLASVPISNPVTRLALCQTSGPCSVIVTRGFIDRSTRGRHGVAPHLLPDGTYPLAVQGVLAPSISASDQSVIMWTEMVLTNAAGSNRDLMGRVHLRAAFPTYVGTVFYNSFLNGSGERSSNVLSLRVVQVGPNTWRADSMYPY
jgi:RHS repeat-associated protein